MNFLRQRPWLWIVLAFLVLIASWTILLRVAAKHRPATVELAPPVSHSSPATPTPPPTQTPGASSTLVPGVRARG